MPDFTPEYDFPYPTGAEAPNGPGAIRALAEAVEAELLVPPPYVRLTATGTTAVASMTKVDLATTTHNDTAYFSVASSVVTVLKTGLYDMHAVAFINTGAAGSRIVRLYVNGAAVGFAQVDAVTSFYGNATLLSYPLTANDTVEMRAQGPATAVAVSGVLTVRKAG